MGGGLLPPLAHATKRAGATDTPDFANRNMKRHVRESPPTYRKGPEPLQSIRTPALFLMPSTASSFREFSFSVTYRPCGAAAPYPPSSTLT